MTATLRNSTVLGAVASPTIASQEWSGMSKRWAVAASLAAVYVIWSSTYLALRFLVETFPPFLGTSIRMLLAGSILFVWVWRRGAPMPTPRQWRNGFAVGVLLFVGGLGLVTLAEDVGVGSGITATAVAMVPVWAALMSGLFGKWPSRTEWTGIVIGLVGVALLSGEGDFKAAPLGLALVVVSPILWSLGSVWSSHTDLPTGSMSAAIQMLGGGVALALVGALLGESITVAPSLKSWLALAWLVIPGSLIAFSAYMYLLRAVRPALATSYAYVNPVFAVILGVTLGQEHLTGQVWVALPIILLSVALIVRSRDRTPHQSEYERNTAGTRVE
jgi:drug/metabolite transporter (DMT)-like permease